MATVTYHGHPALTSLDSADEIPAWDTSAGAARRITFANLLSAPTLRGVVTFATAGGVTRGTLNAGNNTWDIDTVPDATAASAFRFFRSTNTSGLKGIDIYKGDNTATLIHRIGVNQTTTFNANSEDLDFNVRGDNDAGLLFVDASTDRIGIGTTSPATKFHVLESNAATNAVFNLVTLTGRSSGTAAASFGVGLAAQLESSTTNDQDAGRLSWAWDVATHASRAARGKLTAYYVTTERDIITWVANSSSGRVGIMQATPFTTLDVGGGLRVASQLTPSGGAGLELGYDSGSSRATLTAYDRDATAYKTFLMNGFDYQFYVSGSEKIRFDTSGQVGIMNTAPAALLHVGAGTDSPTVAETIGYFSNAGTTAIAVRDSTNNAEAVMYISSSGAIYGTMTSHAVFFRTANTDVLSILANGNVGIGTTSPQAKFHVYDGSGGCIFVNRAGVAGTLVTVIPDGTGDVTERLHFFGVVSNSAAFVAQVNEIYLDVSTSTTKTDGANTLTIAVTAAGAFTLQATAGAATWKVLLWAFWR